jgi:hypothetical protein
MNRRRTVGLKTVWIRGVTEVHPAPLLYRLLPLVSLGEHKNLRTFLASMRDALEFEHLEDRARAP